VALYGWMRTRIKVVVDKMNDKVRSGVLYMHFISRLKSKPNNVLTWATKIPAPERNENAIHAAKGESMSVESKTSELADTTAVPNCITMHNTRRPSKLGSSCGGRRERWEAIATLAAAIIAMTRSSATARMPNKIPKEYEEYKFSSGDSSRPRRSRIKDRIPTCTPAENVACFISVRTDRSII